MARGEHHRIHAQDRMQHNRRRVAQEAARLMSEHGIGDFHHAKRKAAERLGMRDEQSLPRNHEIQQALREHQRLFQSESQPRWLRVRREAAVEAMRFLERFEPRLVGAVLEGIANAHTAVCLHVFSDEPEAVAIYLREHGVPYEMHTRRLRIARDEKAYPVLLFAADDLPFDITVLPFDALRQAPRDHVDEKPMRRASLATVEILLAQESGEQEDVERKGAAVLK